MLDACVSGGRSQSFHKKIKIFSISIRLFPLLCCTMGEKKIDLWKKKG